MKIIARDSEGEIYERADVIHVCTSALGDTKVSIYKSNDAEDRGGIIIKMTVDDPWFNPFVKQVSNGLEIHIAGDCEASQVVKALNVSLQLYSSSC